MLENAVSFFKGLNKRYVLRSALALVAVFAITACVSYAEAGVVYGDSVRSVNEVYGEAAKDEGSVDLTAEVKDDEPKVESELEAEMPHDSACSLVNELRAPYTHKPVVVTTTKETVKETIKFSYKTVKSDKLYKGESKTTKGQNGEKEVVYNVISVNGIVMTREVESEKVLKEAVAQIETVGTKLHAATAVKTSDDVNAISTLKPDKPIELDAKGQPVSYKKVISGKSSAYCGCCDSNSTAYFGSGTARPGYVAVNPKQIPYGTKLYIVSKDGKHVYGYAIAADTGGFAYNGSGRIVDLRMPTGSKCNCGSVWGLKNVNVYILE